MNIYRYNSKVEIGFIWRGNPIYMSSPLTRERSIKRASQGGKKRRFFVSRGVFVRGFGYL